MKRIGFMGGTFNPIHNGHLLLAECAREQYDLDKVLFIPTGCSYLKENMDVESPQNRANMTMAAIEDNPYFELSTIEIDRGGYTYTYETIIALKEDNPENEIHFIMGADCLFTIEKWRSIDIIFQNATLLVAIREGYDRQEFVEKANELERNYGAKIFFVYLPQFDISSTKIRDKIRNNQSVRYLIPQKVFQYIQENNLYSEQK